MVTDLRREFELLRASVRHCLFGSPDRTGLERSLASVDWSLVLWLGHEHRVLLHLLEAIESVGSGCPGAVLDQLRAHRRANAFQRLARARETRGLQDEFDRLGVPVLSVSGWAFSERHYAKPSLRTIGATTKYLIRARDRERAEARLRELGYPAWGEPLEQRPLRSRIVLQADTAWPPGRRAAGSNRKPAQIWNRAEPVGVSVPSIATLSPMDWLLQLSARCGARPFAVDLHVAHDVMAVLLGSPSLDWSEFLGEASRLHVIAQCVIGLATSCDVLDQQRPASIQTIVDRHRRLATICRAIVASSGRAPTARRRVTAPPRVQSDGQAGSLSRYVPTPHGVVDRMLHLAAVGPTDIVYDLGCGDGRIVIAAARDFGARGIGVDCDPERLVEARAAAVGVEDRVSFVDGDLREVDLSDASVVCVFLPRAAGDLIGRLLRRTLRPGARIVSHGMAFPEWPPNKVEIVPSDVALTALIYAWTIPDHVEEATETTTSALSVPSTAVLP